MRIKVEDVHKLPVGKQLYRLQVLLCTECEGKFLGRGGTLYCSPRCAARTRQRRMTSKPKG